MEMAVDKPIMRCHYSTEAAVPEEFATCPCPIVPLSVWMSQPDTGETSRSDMLQMAANLYQQILEGPHQDLAERLTVALGNEGNGQDLAALLDEIKGQVDPALREQLLDLDCAVQCAAPLPEDLTAPTGE